MNVVLAILWKDLVTEWRRRDRVVAMAVFSFLVVIVFHFALPEGATAKSAEAVPGLLWISFLFAGILGLNRSFALELENDALSGLALAPVDRGWIFLGKTAANWLLMSLVEALTTLVFGLVFEIDLLPIALPLAGVVGLATLGFAAVGTLLSAMAVRTRFREVLLPILLLPAMFPLLAGAVQGTAEVLQGGALEFGSLQLLIVAAGVYLIVSFLVFEYVLDE